MDQIGRQRLLARGGANNRRDRQSWQLNKYQCRKLIGASEAAFAAGTPLNRFITIAWGRGGVEAECSVSATGAFVKLAREWLGRHGAEMPWAWVQETGNKFGQHCHLLLHVDNQLDDLFRVMPLRWVKSLLPGPYLKGTLESQKLSSARSAANRPEMYETEILGKLHYMMKCAPERLEGPLGMTGWGHKDWGERCLVLGKRSAVWQGWEGVYQS